MGFSRYKLLSVSADAKTTKGEAYGILTGMLSLASNNTSGYEVCPFATKECRANCNGLYSGRARFSNVRKARINKTKRFFEDRETFLKELELDIRYLLLEADSKGLKPAIRLNGYSDILWENIIVKDGKNFFELFPDVQFYDYTAFPIRHRNTTIKNYHLTFSRKENTPWELIETTLQGGHNVAIVFSGEMPQTFRGYQVINGDTNDVRFNDPQGAIIGLTPKGDLKKRNSDFSIKANKGQSLTPSQS